MFHLSKKMWVLALVALFSLSLVSTAFAEEASGNSFTGFFKKLFHIPVRTTQETAEVIGTTIQNTGEKVMSETGENLASGNVPQAVVQPVVGTAETVGQTAVETVQIPAEVASS